MWLRGSQRVDLGTREVLEQTRNEVEQAGAIEVAGVDERLIVRQTTNVDANFDAGDRLRFAATAVVVLPIDMPSVAMRLGMTSLRVSA